MSDERASREAAFLEAMTEQFRARCAAEAEAVAAWRDGRLKKSALIETLHRIAGSGGTFGHPRLSQQALALEDAAREGDPDPEALEALREALLAVNQGR